MSMITADSTKELFNQITVWKKGHQRAPHKPLLILYALGKCLRKESRLVTYEMIDRDLKQLLIEFGPTRKSYHPEYPFWRLQNDGIWQVSNAEKALQRKSSSDVKKSELLKYNAKGGFPEEIFDLLANDPKLVSEIATQVIESHFPSSIHEDILQAVGIDLSTDLKSKKARDPYFRDRILQAYEYQCAICGFNVRVGNSLVGLEAAHIKWHQAGGPDIEENGIALCSLHHKLFDRGAFTITDNMQIQVSEHAHGTTGFQEWLYKYHGHTIRQPQRPDYYPELQFVTWHLREVFKWPSRQI